MKVLELFAGTRSIGKAFERNGHEVYSIDWNRNFKDIDWYTDIYKVDPSDILERFGRPDVIWASPDCSTYSVAAISHHRRKNPETGELEPISEYAKFCDILNDHVIGLIKVLKPKFYFIENPRAGLRTMSFMKGLPRYTVTYCQYGDTRMKPTDIWTNHPNPNFKPPCRAGAACHERAPRSKTVKKLKELGFDIDIKGTQGLKNATERGRIPDMLCDYIVDICEEGMK